MLNAIDVEKKELVLKESLDLDKTSAASETMFLILFTQLDGVVIYWIDVNPKDSNLLVVGGSFQTLKIYDHRVSKTVQDLNTGEGESS